MIPPALMYRPNCNNSAAAKGNMDGRTAHARLRNAHPPGSAASSSRVRSPPQRLPNSSSSPTTSRSLKRLFSGASLCMACLTATDVVAGRILLYSLIDSRSLPFGLFVMFIAHTQAIHQTWSPALLTEAMKC